MPIPPITKQTYDLANQCALLLWHGINYENGDRQRLSDASMLELLSGKFLKSIQTKKYTNISKQNYRDILLATGLAFHFRGVKLNTVEANRTLFNDIVSIYKSRKFNGHFISKYAYAAQFNALLGEALAKPKPSGNKITLASRVLFFTIPSELGFNLSEKVARKLNLKGTAPSYSMQYCEEFSKALIRDWKQLSSYKMPCRTTEISQIVWNDAYDNGWWQRRILDLAVLLHFKVVSATYAKQSYVKLNKPKKPSPLA